MPRSIFTRVTQSVSNAAGVAYSIGYLLADHVWRRFTGRPSWFEELFDDLDFHIEPGDLEKPYDRPGDINVEPAQAKQTAPLNGRKRKGAE